MKINKLFITGSIVSLVGLSGLLPSAYYWYQSKQIVQAASLSNDELVTQPTVIKSPEVITGKPVSISISSLDLSLNVVDGIYNPKNGQWTLSNDNVHYALRTVQPNNSQGNTLIYGHYRKGVFSTLKSITPGSEVIIRTENGLTFTYKYVSNQVVDPADSSVFEYQGKPRLTLQTCTGAFMQNRQLFYFDLVNVK
jgi:LPXTG-site transpeptidase (sortase) family protein